MKYIKTFENTKNILWMFSYESYEDGYYNFNKLFEDQQSVEDYYFTYLNKEIQKDIDDSDKDISIPGYIFDFDSAQKYLDTLGKYNIEVKQIEVTKFEMPEALQTLREKQKYNL